MAAAGAEIGAWLATLPPRSAGSPSTDAALDSTTAAQPWALELLVTSPLRRAWQTQLIGHAGATRGGFPGTAAGTAWVAHDALSETPYGEGPCKRHPTLTLAAWQPTLDVSLLGPEAVTVAATHLEVQWRGIVAEQGRKQKRHKSEGVGKCGQGAASDDSSDCESKEPQPGHLGDDEEGAGNEAGAVVIARAAEFAAWLRARPERAIWVATHEGPMRRQLEALLGAQAVADRGYAKPKNAMVVALFLPD